MTSGHQPLRPPSTISTHVCGPSFLKPSYLRQVQSGVPAESHQQNCNFCSLQFRRRPAAMVQPTLTLAIPYWAILNTWLEMRYTRMHVAMQQLPRHWFFSCSSFARVLWHRIENYTGQLSDNNWDTGKACHNVRESNTLWIRYAVERCENYSQPA